MMVYCVNHGKCQLHISLNRTAQIYLELQFCVELHTKKALVLTSWVNFVLAVYLC